MAKSDTVAKAFVNAGKEAKKAAGQVAPNSTGINQTPSLSANPTYNIKEAENVIQGKEGTIIIMGRDRPGSETSGTGATAATNVGCIDIIAGLSGPLKRETDSKGDRVATNKSTELDSARIYITERAKDIDSKEYFNLAKGNVGYLSNRSAIAVKADSVRTHRS